MGTIVGGVPSARQDGASVTVNTVDNAVGFIAPPLDRAAGDFGAVYFPWIWSVDPIGRGRNPKILLPPSGFIVTPVLGWWRTPSPIGAVDPAEVAAAHRVPIAELVEPANRFRVRHPSGWVGPAFAVRGMVVWGFTAGLLDRLLALGGWEQPWDPDRVEDLPPSALTSRP